jgi:site-specific recombinase XerD
MARKQRARWQDMDHSDELLIDYIAGARTSQAIGPIPEFLAKKGAEQAPKTLLWYRQSLLGLWEFLEARGYTRVRQFDEHAVNLFRVHLRDRGCSDNTIANRLRAVKAFARWMGQKGWTDGNVLAGLKAPQSTKPHFDLIPDDVRAKLFALFDPDTFLGSRNLAILAVLSDTGLRREEAANVLLRNVDLDAQMIRVYSDKTEEWRYVPLTDEATAIVRNYLKWRERYFAQPARRRINSSQSHRKLEARRVQSDCLFLAWDGTSLSPDGLAEILERASKKLGYRIHAHLFRHDWITRKALDGESPSVVKRWAGHKSFYMTDYYFGLAEEMLGALKPKRSTLAAVALPGVRRRGRPAKRG